MGRSSSSSPSSSSRSVAFFASALVAVTAVLLGLWLREGSSKTSGLQPLIGSDPPPSGLFPPSDALATLLPPTHLAPGIVGSRAIPTNKWWANWIAASSAEQIPPVWPNPFAVRPETATAPFGLAVSYPFRTRVFGGGSGIGDAAKYYLHGFARDWLFSAREFTSAPTFEVVDWDDLGVTAQLHSPQSTSRMETVVVSGMAFATVKYVDATPRFSSVHSILAVNGQSATPSDVFTSDRYILKLNSGQILTLYLSRAVTLTLVNSVELQANAPFTGTARVALIQDEDHIEAFDERARCVVEGGDIDIANETNYLFRWKTSGDCSSGLLHYAHLHHLDTMDRTAAIELPGITAFSATRGLMTALSTSTPEVVWRFKVDDSFPVDFYPVHRPDAHDVKDQRILQRLVEDLDAEWSIPESGSYYFNGKAAQKYASLCLVASDPSIVGGDARHKEKCVRKLRIVLSPFLTNTWRFKLHYDTVYRGIVTSEASESGNIIADFGNGMYNDHHYHYGYWVVTAAIVNKLDPDWAELPALNRMATFLLRDAANPSSEDEFFPPFRHFDWFRGHSYSHGVTPLGDGKDQESSSEDINLFYGMALLGDATGNQDLAALGRLLVRLNARAIQTYFLMTHENQAHPEQLRGNKVVGILFDNKVDYGTWFSAETHAIHGIQMIPVSPITEFVRTKQFVQEEWQDVLSKSPIVANLEASNPWLSLLLVNYARLDKLAACSTLQHAAMDDGLSRTWALYMAVART
jgi:endo-1,3(4)-beta-glucanase